MVVPTATETKAVESVRRRRRGHVSLSAGRVEPSSASTVHRQPVQSIVDGRNVTVHLRVGRRDSIAAAGSVELHHTVDDSGIECTGQLSANRTTVTAPTITTAAIVVGHSLGYGSEFEPSEVVDL